MLVTKTLNTQKNFGGIDIPNQLKRNKTFASTQLKGGDEEEEEEEEDVLSSQDV